MRCQILCGHCVGYVVIVYYFPALESQTERRIAAKLVSFWVKSDLYQKVVCKRWVQGGNRVAMTILI